MKINRVSSEKNAPSWAFENISFDEVANVEESVIEEINQMPEKLSENDVVDQMERIANCSNNKKPYYYNSQWNEKLISSLHEYAVVCGLKENQFRAVHPEYIEDIKVIKREAKMSKQASTDTDTIEAPLILNDPFHLEDISDDRKTLPKKDHWEKVNKEAKLENNPDGRPSMMTNAIRSIKGGENYFKNSFTQTAKGQNTIGIPNAIKDYIESDIEDNGSRIRKQNNEIKHSRIKENKEWRESQMAELGELKENDIVTKGTVFPTESMVAQPGLNGPSLNNLNKDTMPDKTLGEEISDMNKKAKKSIQREEQDNEWEGIKSHSLRGISDVFADSLKKQFNKE